MAAAMKMVAYAAACAPTTTHDALALHIHLFMCMHGHSLQRSMQHISSSGAVLMPDLQRCQSPCQSASQPACASQGQALPAQVVDQCGDMMERQRLVSDGLNVPCELAPEHGGLGLRYHPPIDPQHASALQPGDVIGVYAGHMGRQPKLRFHNKQPPIMNGVLRDEYTLQLSECMLYAKPGRRSAGAINESARPNVGFYPVCIDIDGHDNPLISFCVLLVLRPIQSLQFFSIYYGDDFQATREARGYTIKRLAGRNRRVFTPHEAELALRDAYTMEELQQLSSFAGVADFGSSAGSKGDPNRFWGGPFSQPVRQSSQPGLQGPVSSTQV